VAFGSLEHLQSSMSAAGNGMSGSGWLWLVSDQIGGLGIVATYGAGTLLVRSRTQQIPPIHDELMQSSEPEASHAPLESAPSRLSASPPHTSSPLSGMSLRQSNFIEPSTPSRIMSSLPSWQELDVPEPSRANSLVAGYVTHNDRRGEYLNPLLCISIHEHAWIGSGYGVWGKRDYLKAFWSVVDWGKVAGHFNHWIAMHSKQNT